MQISWMSVWIEPDETWGSPAWIPYKVLWDWTNFGCTAWACTDSAANTVGSWGCMTVISVATEPHWQPRARFSFWPPDSGAFATLLDLAFPCVIISNGTMKEAIKLIVWCHTFAFVSPCSVMTSLHDKHILYCKRDAPGPWIDMKYPESLNNVWCEPINKGNL